MIHRNSHLKPRNVINYNKNNLIAQSNEFICINMYNTNKEHDTLILIYSLNLLIPDFAKGYFLPKEVFT